MKYRVFGRTGWQVSEIGFGAWQIGGDWGAVDDHQSIKINDVKGAELGPDHAGMFETTLLGALWPERVDVSRLPARAQQDWSDDDPWSARRHDPTHPLWGVIGPDPRNYNAAGGPALLAACVNWVVGSGRWASGSLR